MLNKSPKYFLILKSIVNYFMYEDELLHHDKNVFDEELNRI